jgi:ribosomal protein S18 acetylase RimI-like enzyme
VVSVEIDTRHEEVNKAVLAGLVAFNTAAMGGDGGRQPISISVRDGETIVGGAVGRLWHGWVYVDLFWISEHLRGQDIGTQVMDALETHARSLGARGVHLVTYSWQARPFYEKRGYRVVGELPDYPPGNSCYVLAKKL